MTAYLVGAMDDRLLQKLAEAGINTFSMNSGLTENDFGWGSENFHKMVSVKFQRNPDGESRCPELRLSFLDSADTHNMGGGTALSPCHSPGWLNPKPQGCNLHRPVRH